VSSLTTPSKVTVYATKVGATWPTDSTEQTQAIARATRYLNSLHWDGIRTNGRSQANAFPRAGIVDRDGYGVDGTTIPPEIEEAANLLAIAEAATPNTLQPSVTLDNRVIEETIGPLSFKYERAKGPGGAREIVTAASDLIRPFLANRSFMLTRA
jgi:hypothetical protein